jgi:hypothetical protein
VHAALGAARKLAMDLSDIACSQAAPADKPAIYIFLVAGVLLLYVGPITLYALARKALKKPARRMGVKRLPELASFLLVAAVLSTAWSVRASYNYWAHQILIADQSHSYAWLDMRLLHCTMGNTAIICWLTLSSTGVLVLLAYYLRHVSREEGAEQ